MKTTYAKSQAGKVICSGGWPTKEKQGKCPDSPRSSLTHCFGDKSSKPSGRDGELLVTSECLYCGALVKDCPTIGIF